LIHFEFLVVDPAKEVLAVVDEIALLNSSIACPTTFFILYEDPGLLA